MTHSLTCKLLIALGLKHTNCRSAAEDTILQRPAACPSLWQLGPWTIGEVQCPLTASILLCSLFNILHACCRLAGVHTITADASSISQPLVSHLNQEGEVVAIAGQTENQQAAAVADSAPDMGTCDPKYWSCPGAAGYKIRGSTYLKVSHPSLQ